MSLQSLARRNIDTFNPTCPEGAKWYACPSDSRSKFVGCCAGDSDPCGSLSGCTSGNVRPVSFNASSHGTPDFPPDASCGSVSFYTCVQGEKTFWGCCKSMPCDTLQCSNGDLVPAFMDAPSQFEAYASENSTTTSSSSPTGSPTGSPSPSPSSTDSKGSSNTAVYVGAGVGGAVVIVAIFAILIFCLRRRKRSSKSSIKNDNTPAFGAVEKSNRSSELTDAPPTYSSPQANNFLPAAGYQHKYQQVAQSPQPEISELPAELGSPDLSASPALRYSELPSPDPSHARYSELASPPLSQSHLRYSELPGPVSPPTQRFSELPVDDQPPRARAAELDTPTQSPMIGVAEFAGRSPLRASVGPGAQK